MANSKLLDTQYEHYKSVIDEIFKQLHQLTLTIGNKKLSSTVDDIRSRLNEPFLFVIVGEVKVGKSSFVNALLQSDKEICKVAPDPCTDTIQQIVYGETESVIPINDFLKKITLPIDILQKIAIVDTPGTNAVIDKHTEITEKFIPVSDLIIFVFEAKNPYRRTSWEFFDYISKEWRKKVIFVLQQSDLMEPDDLVVNKNGVLRYAKQHGVSEPLVFTVSAKMEKKGLHEESGFVEVRNFIKNTITGGQNVRLKVKSLIETSQNIFNTIQNGVDERSLQLKTDQDFRQKINSLLSSAEAKIGTQVETLIDDVLREYDKITADIQEDFEEGLGFFRLIKKSIFSVFGSEPSLKEWGRGITERFDQELRPALERKIREGIVNIADSIKQMAEIIDGEIRSHKASIKSNNHVFGAIADKRQEKLDRLSYNIGELMHETEAFIQGESMRKSSDLIPNIATGSGLMLIGGILAGVTQGAVFDITGGVIAIIGFSMASFLTAAKSRRIVKEFNTEIYNGRVKLKEQIQARMDNYVKEIRVKIDNNFLEFDTFLNDEERNLNTVIDQFDGIKVKFDDLAKDLGLKA